MRPFVVTDETEDTHSMNHSQSANELADAVEAHFSQEWPNGSTGPALDVYLSPHVYVERYSEETGDCEGPGFLTRRYTAAGLLENRFLSRHPGMTIED